MLCFDSHADLSDYLQKIDDGMRRDGVPIAARQFQALSRISVEYGGMEFDITAAMRLTEKDIVGYEGDALTRRIINWFDVLYGDRLKISFREGKSVALVRGDPYLMSIPIALGDVDFTFDVATLGKSGSKNKEGRTIVNVFDSLLKITDSTVSLTSLKEGLRLANELRSNTYCFRVATSISKYDNTFDVRPDLDAAAQQIVEDHANFGMSRWHSLQAAEKALKSVLSCQGLGFPKVHDLYHLVHASGMLGISPLALDATMCAPSVRYEPEFSNLEKAIRAHHASLDICLEAGRRIADIGRSKADQRPAWVERRKE